MNEWAKLLTSEKRGQVVVMLSYDSDEDKSCITIQYRTARGSHLTLTTYFDDETSQQAAFDAINADNIDSTIESI